MDKGSLIITYTQQLQIHCEWKDQRQDCTPENDRQHNSFSKLDRMWIRIYVKPSLMSPDLQELSYPEPQVGIPCKNIERFGVGFGFGFGEKFGFGFGFGEK